MVRLSWGEHNDFVFLKVIIPLNVNNRSFWFTMGHLRVDLYEFKNPIARPKIL